jgi:hypothetical protein
MANIVRFPVGPRESVGAFAGPALVIPVLKAVRGRRGTAIAEYPRFRAGAGRLPVSARGEIVDFGGYIFRIHQAGKKGRPPLGRRPGERRHGSDQW